MSDVAQWLEGLGLGQYAKTFADNDVDLDVLSDLGEGDLEKLGVSLGHRKKLLRAIAALSDIESQQKDTIEPASVTDRISSHAETLTDAERRQLTVMFVDLVGSTALSGQLDPEDLRDVIHAYQNAVAGEIARFEGHVAKFMGDGVLAYFGWPRAHEGEAERAARAGLAVADTVGRLTTPAGQCLSARIGIATGLVVVGNLVGKGAAREEAVVGETPNLAARLQGVAEPGQVVLSETTRRLLGDQFELSDLGTLSVKGFGEPIHAWRVVRECDIDSGHESKRVGGGLPLVGRQEELGLLLRSWEVSKEGHGQVVLIQGEPGIGKSRLIWALRERLSAERHIWVAVRCSPYHANSTLYPIIEHMKRAMGWKPEDSAGEKLEKLESVLTRQSLSPEQAVPLFAELNSLPLPEGRYAPLGLSAEQQREQTLDALAGWLMDEAEQMPVLQVWEDVHWADATTLELLARYIEQSPTVSMLNVLTYRPEFAVPWPMRTHMTPITLNRLERPDVEALIGYQANGRAVPSEVIEHVIGKADGVPLYVEELTKAILESDYLRVEADRYALAGSLSEISIPATLQDSLMARLDRLPRAREIAQLGAVLGREFAYEMLQALAEVEEPQLRDRLGQLVDAELLYQRGRPPRARYIFKHALIQDAAYASLLKRTRQRYHRQIAALLEERFPEAGRAHPELVAHHLAEAGRTSQAVTYLRMAGQMALGRSANVEAAAHFERGLALLSQLPETPQRQERELEMQLALGPALVAARGFANPGVGRAYASAWELCRRLEDNVHLPLVLRGREVFHYVSGEFHKAREFAKQLLDLAERQHDPALHVGGCHALGQDLFQMGELITALRTVEQGIALFDPEQHRLRNWPGGQPGEQCYLYGAFSLWMLGYPDQSLGHAQKALALARDLSNPPNLVNTLAFVALIHLLRGDVAATRQLAQATMEMSHEQRNPFFLAWGRILGGWAKGAQDASAEGIDEIRQGMAEYRATGARTWLPYFLGLQAETYARAGRLDDALASVAEALALGEKTEERCWQAELCRVKGDLLLAVSSSNHVEAGNFFAQSLEIARKQQAKSWELRTAMSLGRLWHQQGKVKKARKMLSKIHGWFTEGFETADLKEATQLLDELA